MLSLLDSNTFALIITVICIGLAIAAPVYILKNTKKQP